MRKLQLVIRQTEAGLWCLISLPNQYFSALAKCEILSYEQKKRKRRLSDATKLVFSMAE